MDNAWLGRLYNDPARAGKALNAARSSWERQGFIGWAFVVVGVGVLVLDVKVTFF